MLRFGNNLQLSMWRCSDELRAKVQQIEASNRKDAKHYMGTDVLSTEFNVLTYF
jgi:hypothetical protein